MKSSRQAFVLLLIASAAMDRARDYRNGYS